MTDTPQDYTPSWYADTANPHPAVSGTPSGDVDCDVCVVGGGYTGLSVAIELAIQGYNTVVLEAHKIGWGASGRNGGQAIRGFNASPSELSKLVGADTARALWALSDEAVDLLEDRIETYGIACDYRRGAVLAAVKGRHMRDLEDYIAECESFGEDGLRLVDRDGMREHAHSDRYVGGMFDERSGHLHPLNYALGLGGAALKEGAKIYEATEVTALDRDAPRPVLRTSAGAQVTADKVVLAGNAYLGKPGGKIMRRIMPVGTYVIATEPLGESRATELMPRDTAVSDMNFVLDYYRRSADHRLLFGGGVSYTGFETHLGLQALLRSKMLRVFPQLSDVDVTHCWGGHVGITINRLPDLGRIGENVFYAQGFSGHGILLTGIAGRAIAKAVGGAPAQFDAFARIPHRGFPGGAMLRRPALVAAMMWYRLRDLL